MRPVEGTMFTKGECDICQEGSAASSSAFISSSVSFAGVNASQDKVEELLGRKSSLNILSCITEFSGVYLYTGLAD